MSIVDEETTATSPRGGVPPSGTLGPGAALEWAPRTAIRPPSTTGVARATILVSATAPPCTIPIHDIVATSSRVIADVPGVVMTSPIPEGAPSSVEVVTEVASIDAPTRVLTPWTRPAPEGLRLPGDELRVGVPARTVASVASATVTPCLQTTASIARDGMPRVQEAAFLLVPLGGVLGEALTAASHVP